MKKTLKEILTKSNNCFIVKLSIPILNQVEDILNFYVFPYQTARRYKLMQQNATFVLIYKHKNIIRGITYKEFFQSCKF